MAWSRDINKGSVQLRNQRFGLSTIESSPGRGISSPHYEFYELEAAEVLDIILDENHPDFNSYVDIGKVKIRMVVSENGKEESTLSYAKPLDSNLKSYPLLHEIVIVVQHLNELYYTQRLNVLNSSNQNAVPGISLSTLSLKQQSKGSVNAQSYESVSTSGTPNKKNDQQDISLGKVFKANIDIKPIKPYEGDIIYEGRFGQSIRFGSTQENGASLLKIKVGQPNEVPDNPIQPIEEDINNDLSSIWIVNDENVPFVPSTAENEIHLQFYSDRPNEFQGNQIFINSNRIILNSKTEEIMAFSKKATNLVTEGIFTIDAIDDIITNTTSRTIVNSPEIYLGGEDANESIVLGNTLLQLLQEMIDLLVQHVHPTGTGPSGPILTPVDSQLQQMKNKLESMLSKRNFSL